MRTILVLAASAFVIDIASAPAGKQGKKNLEDAGGETNHAARKTGRKVNRTIKEAVHKSSEKIAEGAGKVKRKIIA